MKTRSMSLPDFAPGTETETGSDFDSVTAAEVATEPGADFDSATAAAAVASDSDSWIETYSATTIETVAASLHSR